MLVDWLSVDSKVSCLSSGFSCEKEGIGSACGVGIDAGTGGFGCVCRGFRGPLMVSVSVLEVSTFCCFATLPIGMRVTFSLVISSSGGRSLLRLSNASMAIFVSSLLARIVVVHLGTFLTSLGPIVGSV